MKFASSFNKILTAALLVCLGAGPAIAQSGPSVRIKDVADIEGVRENMLVGYGLVVGLMGTGDTVASIPFTRQTLINMLERLGVNSKSAQDQLKTKNVAAVMVTANMPSFARQGSKVDVTLSSLGDAKSLQGGVLLATPLIAADGNTYAVAQGPVIVGGFTAEGAAGTITKNHTTVARIADGATVEVETGFELSELGNKLRLILKNPDFTTAMRMKDAINKLNGLSAKAVDHGTIDVALPENMTAVTAIHLVENTRVTPDTPARVVIDEKTGTIVMGEDVRIGRVAISHANLTIRVTEMQQVSQPESLAPAGGVTFAGLDTTTSQVSSSAIDYSGTTITGTTDNLVTQVLEELGEDFQAIKTGANTEIVDRTSIDAEEEGGKFTILNGGANLADLVNGLNALGVKPRDIISILQNIKAAGAMQAELKIM